MVISFVTVRYDLRAMRESSSVCSYVVSLPFKQLCIHSYAASPSSSLATVGQASIRHICYAQSMDCAVQSMDPRFVQRSMDCLLNLWTAQSSDLCQTWIGLNLNVVKIASHLSHPSSFP